MTTNEPVDIETVLSNAPLGAFHFIVVGLSALMIMLDGYDAQSIAFAAPLLAKALGRNVSSFGPIFAVGLVGLMLGSLAVSPLADRYGRKWLLITSTVIFGFFSLAPALDPSFERLFVYRLLTGFGLGGAMPCAVALTSEYAPRRNKAALVNIMFAGFPLGAVVGGFVVSLIIVDWGWQAIFYVGGVLPLLMVPVLMLLMPESIVFLVADGRRPRAIAHILSRFKSTNVLNPENVRLSQDPTEKRGSVTNLFDQQRGFGTILLWVGFFCNLLLIYFLVNWIPAVLDLIGLPAQHALMGTVVLNVGGVVGGVCMGLVIDRYGAARPIYTAFLLAAACVALIGQSIQLPAVATAIIFLSGLFVIGAQLSMNALAANFYPINIRSTGVGWALGIGRVGSIIGPVVGGLALSWKWSLATIFTIAAVPALAGALSMFLLGRRYPRHGNATSRDGFAPA